MRDDDDTLSGAIWAVARQLRHQSLESLAPWDISPSQSRALMVLYRRGGTRPGELSAMLRIAPRSATEVIDSLEQRGFVTRRSDPADRRATLVEVTDAGRDLIKATRAARGSEAEQLFGHLSATDQAHLRRILRKLREIGPVDNPG